MESVVSSSQMDAWSSMLSAMPIPAALVDINGRLLAVNRWLDGKPGEQLLLPSDDPTSTMRFGVNDSRWRVRPVGQSETILLATGEREDAGDHLLRKFFSSNDALFVVYDQDGRVIESNTAWERLLGYSGDEVFGLDSWTLLPPDDVATRQAVEAELREHGRSDPTFLMRTSSGDYRLVQWNLHFDFSVGRCFGIGRDITEEEKQAAELERRAYTDELTGLANRTKLGERLDALVANGSAPALLYCDLDHFKVVNDSLGHTVGDLLLAGIAQRFTEALSPFDDVTIARFGGDEFVILIDDAEPAIALDTAEILLQALREPIDVAGRDLHAAMSVGIATCDGGSGAHELINHADTAVYEAKRLGRGQPVLFDAELQERAERRFHVEDGLRQAIRNDGIQAVFHPIVEIHTRKIVGAEALVRWTNEEGETMNPAEFLDVAEEASLGREIGAVVVEQALDFASAATSTFPDFWISVNTTQAELLTDGFAQRLTAKAESVGLPPSQVIIEIVESAVISTDLALPVLELLQQQGFRIALDDFGTGFSSLAHLRDLPIDIVKVGRSFVSTLHEDPIAYALTESLIDLAESLGLTIVMEGIETAEEEHAVTQIGGSLAQGYRYYKPMSGESLLDLWADETLQSAA